MPTTRGFLQLDLRRFVGWRKAVAGGRFIPVAWSEIQNRRLRARHTFHLVDRADEPIGLSAGDVSYSSNEDDLRLISRLVVEFEDRRFFDHCGIDVIGILRAFKNNLAAGRIVQGGSTITQQLVRNTLLTPDRSFARKVLEGLLALAVERHYSKQEILRLYCELVHLGPGIRGFQAASRLIYRRPLGQLDVVSLCGLVGLLRQPARSYPEHNLDIFRQRQVFLSRKHAVHSGIKEVACSHSGVTPTPNPIPARRLIKPRWTRVTQQVCEKRGISFDNVRRVGLTIDRVLQARVDHLLRKVSENQEIDSIGAVVLDNGYGDVLAESAWSHGKDCEQSPTFSGGLQPGSTFKPFALLGALEEGYGSGTLLDSSPFESSYIKNSNGSRWRVRNYAHEYRGEVTLAEALRFSDNTAFARLTELVPLSGLQSTYERFGLSEGNTGTPAIVLGAVRGGVSLLQLVAAYSTIARNGVYVEPRIVRFIHYLDGGTWWPPESERERVVVATYALAAQLKLTLTSVLPQLARYGFAGKTGTTRRGSLVAVYDDRVSVAVWLGHTRPRSEMDTKSVSALKVVERLIAEALLGHPRDAFTI